MAVNSLQQEYRLKPGILWFYWTKIGEIKIHIKISIMIHVNKPAHEILVLTSIYRRAAKTWTSLSIFAVWPEPLLLANTEDVDKEAKNQNLRMRNRKAISLFLNQNKCCGYSKQPFQRDGSFEHPKHMLEIIGKKIFTILRRNFYVYLSL